MPPSARAPLAVDRGLAFLSAHQLESGQFATYVGRDLRGETEFETSPFTTAAVVNAITDVASPRVQPMVARAVDFLADEMLPGGAWRYWASDHAVRDLIPADADDTACVSEALRRHGRDVDQSRRVLLANRDRRGRFYTWIVPRLPPPLSVSYWRVAVRQRRAGEFFSMHALERDDVSAVVNANVLLYIGDGRAARPVVEYLSDVMDRGAEGSSDTWYDNEFPFYYAVARCIARGIDALGALSDGIIRRIVAAQDERGAVGPTVLETALAASALHALGGAPAAAERACDFLLAEQAGDGGWEIAPLYHGGGGTVRWGSRELTTAFCVEALAGRSRGPESRQDDVSDGP